MNGGGLSAEEREALARTVTLHKAARATTVAGELRWICDGCGQPLAPSEPNAAFADLTVHQSVMLDDLFESFLAARASDGLADKVRAARQAVTPHGHPPICDCSVCDYLDRMAHALVPADTQDTP